MTAIRSTFLPATGAACADGLLEIHPTDNETFALAERILDGDCTVFADFGEVVAVALNEDACERLERDEREGLPSLDYAFDLLADAVNDLDFERDPRRMLKLLREELENVAGDIDKIRKGEK